MILGMRCFDQSPFRGFQIVTVRDWVLPIESLGQGVFKSFDESLRKLKADPQATRIKVEKQDLSSPATLLNTATLTALRSVPERFRKGVKLYSLALLPGPLGITEMWWQWPQWASLSWTALQGELSWLENPNPTQGSPFHWNRSETDLSLGHHLSLHLFCNKPLVHTEGRFFRFTQAWQECHRSPKTWGLTLSCLALQNSEDFRDG